jgi:4-hydroxy-2-oxoglutarate aldolase
MTRKLKGIFAPLCTPFDRFESVDYAALAGNMKKYSGTGLAGYFALGSNGEAKSLSHPEKARVLGTIIDNRSAGQIVLAGCSFESTRESISFGEVARDLGADYLSLLPPSYFRKHLTEEALLKHFSTIASKVDIPCILYNAPQFCNGVEITASMAAAVSKDPGIIGIKHSSKTGITDLLEALPSRFSVLAGSADFFFDAMKKGAAGGVLSLANVFPELCCQLHSMAIEGDEKAEELNHRITMLNKRISGSGGVAAVKYAMDMSGFSGGAPRLPLLPLPEGEKTSMREYLKKENLIS